MWRFAVLEIYSHMSCDDEGPVAWPAEGSPSDWIEQELVGYCDGDERDFVSFIPLWKILVWRVIDKLSGR